MSDLRDTILAALAKSSSKEPVDISTILKITGANRAAADSMLSMLHAEHIVNHVEGIRAGKPFSCYWLTGAVHSAMPFTISLASPRRPRTDAKIISQTSAKVQPNTSIPPKKETVMPSPSDLRVALLDLITKNPGIKKPDLIKRALAKAPGATERQADKALDNMKHISKLITSTGKGDLASFTLPETDLGINLSPTKKKAVKPKKSRVKILIHQGNHNIPPAVIDPAPMKYGFNLGGSFSIRKNGRDILLSPDEAMDLMQFGSQQVAMINHLPGEKQ